MGKHRNHRSSLHSRALPLKSITNRRPAEEARESVIILADEYYAISDIEG